MHPASPMPDIDSADSDDPLQASDLACEIFAYYKRMEAVYRPLPTYMSRQVGRLPSPLLPLLSIQSSGLLC